MNEWIEWMDYFWFDYNGEEIIVYTRWYERPNERGLMEELDNILESDNQSQINMEC